MDPDRLKQLINFGFEKTESEVALRAYKNNVDQAMDSLFRKREAA